MSTCKNTKIDIHALGFYAGPYFCLAFASLETKISTISAMKNGATVLRNRKSIFTKKMFDFSQLSGSQGAPDAWCGLDAARRQLCFRAALPSRWCSKTAFKSAQRPIFADSTALFPPRDVFLQTVLHFGHTGWKKCCTVVEFAVRETYFCVDRV